MTAKIITIILVLVSAPCFSEDRIRSYSDEKGNTVYTNERTTQQSNGSNTSGKAINNRNRQNIDDSFVVNEVNSHVNRV